MILRPIDRLLDVVAVAADAAAATAAVAVVGIACVVKKCED